MQTGRFLSANYFFYTSAAVFTLCLTMVEQLVISTILPRARRDRSDQRLSLLSGAATDPQQLGLPVLEQASIKNSKFRGHSFGLLSFLNDGSKTKN